jgi:hypothetical protein
MTAWFKPRRYGYGATPISWQGWMITAGAVALIAVAALMLLGFNRAEPPDAGRVALFLGIDALVIAALWFVSRRTTVGEWRWRWGRQDQEENGNRK